jgi:hypothetical protein
VEVFVEVREDVKRGVVCLILGILAAIVIVGEPIVFHSTKNFALKLADALFLCFVWSLLGMDRLRSINFSPYLATGIGTALGVCTIAATVIGYRKLWLFEWLQDNVERAKKFVFTLLHFLPAPKKNPPASLQAWYLWTVWLTFCEPNAGIVLAGLNPEIDKSTTLAIVVPVSALRNIFLDSVRTWVRHLSPFMGEYFLFLLVGSVLIYLGIVQVWRRIQLAKEQAGEADPVPPFEAEAE